jgi:hypothetical protein
MQPASESEVEDEVCVTNTVTACVLFHFRNICDEGQVLNSVAIAVQKGNAITILGAHAAALLRAA